MTALEDTHGREESDARSEAGAADFELASELAFGRKAIAWMNLPAADERANVLDDLHGERAVASDLVLRLFKLFFHAE